MLFFSSKKNIAALFVIGTLFSTCNQANALLSQHEVRALRAVTVAAGTYYFAGYREITDEENKNLVTKTLDLVTRVVRAPINFYNKNKDAVHLTISAALLAYYGSHALNLPLATLNAAHFKAAPVVGAFVKVPTPTPFVYVATTSAEAIANLVVEKLKP